ncbi:hypothetical protein OS493_011511 [Desmophyllum pertusum]|uniref:Uncharacterized protein n=1 Tax=Desmophyllum pertusum TaxID=174260 RepID=A0A9W9YTM5_9CNID|nr:hypothetical protein OS493_011511 [Desmophyllum pertusum]
MTFMPSRDISVFTESRHPFLGIEGRWREIVVHNSKEKMLCHLLRTGAILMLMLWNILAAERAIYVSPSGNDSLPCTEDAPCRTVDAAFSLASGLNSTRIILAKGNYTMKNSHRFTKMTSFGLFGNGSIRDDVQILCDVNISLSFTLSENITFEGIKLQKCGGWHQSTDYPDLHDVKFKTALDFRYCRNLRISDVEISSSPGLGANLYDVGGVVTFTDSAFADNNASNDNNSDAATELEPHHYVYSGGGISVNLNRYGHNTVNVTPSEHDSYQHDNHYMFSNCNFLRNEARLSRTRQDQEERITAPELPFSSGGGLVVYFEGNASGCTVEIQACVFKDNLASWGGGLQVEMKDNTEDNNFTMEGTMFWRNKAVLAGGGARMGNVPFKGVQLTLNRFNISNCSFAENKAEWGGGTSLIGTTIPRKCAKHTDPFVTQFYFYRCRWLKNVGNVGAAMGLYIYNKNEDQIGPEIPFRVSFDSGTLFESNEVHLQNRNLTIGQGALYSMEVPVIFKNSTTFLNNSKTALVLDGSTLELHDQLEFINNTGFRGGAIAMYGRSRIIFQENAKLTFEANTCEDKGGALYIQAPGPPLVSFNSTGTNIYTCFFGYSNQSVDYDDWNAMVIFKDNKASQGHPASGKAIYVTTLKTCWKPGESRQHNSVLRWKFVKFENLPANFSNFSGEVATDPMYIKHEKGDWQVAPGYWAGMVNDGTFSTYVCPYGYCKESHDSSSKEYQYYEDKMCNKYRNQSSILCGQCDEDYSITVGSEKCKKDCTYWNLFILIPFAVGFLLLVMGIMLINLDVFTGYLNAWLYSYQVMKLLIPAWLNLNVFSEFLIALTDIRIQVGGHSFCFIKGLDDADKLLLMYAIPVYVIVIVILLAKVVGAFPNWCFSRRVRAPFRGICTILVLCYTDVTSISLKILQFATVGSNETVLYANGSIEYFSGKHLYYGIVAILFIVVFVIPFPLILLFRPFLTNGLRPVLNLNRWNPFFDTLQSCFQDRYRWCAAFYFICRLGILLIHTFVPAGPVQRLLLEGTCILILLTFAFLRPYKRAIDVNVDEKNYEWMNISDVVLLTTLAFIAVVSSPIDNSCATTDGQKRGFKIVLNILSFVPFAVLVVWACCVARQYLPAACPDDDETVPIMTSETSDYGTRGRPPSISETSDTPHSSRGSSRGSEKAAAR